MSTMLDNEEGRKLSSTCVENRDELVAYLESGCKPADKWVIGTEHEKFGFDIKTRQPIPYDGPAGVKAIFDGLITKYDWEPVLENGKMIALYQDGQAISLEPGGQFELSGAPLPTVHKTCGEVNTHLDQVKDIAGQLGIGFIGMGFHPTASRADFDTMPKDRYGIMTAYMPKKGTMGLDMMYRTCTVQVNLDFGSEQDMARKFRVGMALQPLATALFANSPFKDGLLSDFISLRANVWTDTDNERCGTLPFVFDDGFGFEQYADYALDVPMYFVYRDGNYINALGQSFRDFLQGKLPALPGETPTLSDWADHLTTVFPEARIKKFIEMRGADGGPWRRLCALPAFWVGLLYDQTALDAAWDLVKGWDAETRDELRVAASVDGLQAKVNGIDMHDLAREAVAISEIGLKARARPGAGGMVPDETHFLNALKESIETGHVPADELLDHYNGDWNGDLTRIYSGFSY